MRPRTVDLLRIRDDEPVAADVRAAVDADVDLTAELARLSELRRELQALPPLSPPRDAWPAIAAELRQRRAQPPARGVHWALRGGLAAAVAVVALAVVTRSPTPIPEPPPQSTVGAASVSAPLLGAAAYASLVAQSAELERALDGFGPSSRIVRVGTAATVADLESGIGAIDTQLTFARQMGLQSDVVADLHRQRVDLLNALVQVRYAEQLRHAGPMPTNDLRRFAY